MIEVKIDALNPVSIHCAHVIQPCIYAYIVNTICACNVHLIEGPVSIVKDLMVQQEVGVP